MPARMPHGARRWLARAAALAAALLAAVVVSARPGVAVAQAEHPLAGLWEASNHYGPWARGQLVIRRQAGAWSGEIRGRSAPAQLSNGELVLDLGPRGKFRGRFVGKALHGFWITPPAVIQWLPRASAVTLRPAGPDAWMGEVRPMDDSFTLYLQNRPQPDGTLASLLRNPDRDHGAQLGVKRIEMDGARVRLIGQRRNQPEQEVATGAWNAEQQTLSLYFPNRGGTFDFRRAGDGSDFYPRGRRPDRYVYRQPAPRDDGWPVGSIEDAGIDRAAVERAIQLIADRAPEGYDTPQVDAVLIARHGQLVLEEYFHGYDADRLHATRSASKIVATTLAGAVMQDGTPLRLDSRVYQVMNGGAFPEGLDPRKRAMTLDHLLTMASGFHCDDNDDAAPGRENFIIDELEEDDFWRYSLSVPMAFDPGERSIYCSMNPNLALGVIANATGESPLYSFDRLVARPLKMGPYSWMLDRAGNPYAGGGTEFRPRDFMKFGQLMLNEGVWDGRRVLPRDYARFVAATPLRINGTERQYGRLWWGYDWPWRGRTVHAYAALGAGGQNLIVVPELDLVVATFSSNFFTRGQFFNTDELTPKMLLPAVAGR